MQQKLLPTLIFFLTTGFVSINFAQVSDNPLADTTKPGSKNEFPYFTVSKLPFQAPQFDKIKDSDFEPAFEEGMEENLAEIEKIADNPQPATFENTLVALEKSGQLFRSVKLIFNGLTSANTDSVLQNLQEEIAPKLAAHNDAIYLNAKLFERVKSIYDKRKELKLDNESEKLITYYYDHFVHAGAKLSADDKSKLKKLNEEEASLIAKFINMLLAATKNGALIVNDKSELAGLTDAELKAASQSATERDLTGKWVITLQNTTQQPFLTSLENRQTRKKLFENSWNRTEQNDENDTRSVIKRIAEIRVEKATLLGFSNYAGWVLEDQMAKTPEAVEKFLSGLVPATVSSEQKEAADIQAYMKQSGENFKLEAMGLELLCRQTS